MKNILSLLLILMATTVFAQKDETAIRTMLAAQVMAWNQGDIAGYMKGYWDNDSLIFIGKNGPTYGYRQTLERYQKSYPDAAAMGTLRSDIISLKRLAPEYFFAVGKWHLQRKAGDLSGSWTLLIRKIRGQWVIVTDHSS